MKLQNAEYRKRSCSQQAFRKQKIRCTRIKSGGKSGTRASGLDKPVMLIMSGGVGCGNILELCDTLERCSSGDYLACVLTGHNASLKQSIDERFASAGRIKTVSFTKQVNLYMNAADVMLSKPGGLTSTEAAVANVPLVQMLTYAACEAKNIAFFTSHGLRYVLRMSAKRFRQCGA